MSLDICCRMVVFELKIQIYMFVLILEHHLALLSTAQVVRSLFYRVLAQKKLSYEPCLWYICHKNIIGYGIWIAINDCICVTINYYNYLAHGYWLVSIMCRLLFMKIFVTLRELNHVKKLHKMKIFFYLYQSLVRKLNIKLNFERTIVI